MKIDKLPLEVKNKILQDPRYFEHEAIVKQDDNGEINVYKGKKLSQKQLKN